MESVLKWGLIPVWWWAVIPVWWWAVIPVWWWAVIPVWWWAVIRWHLNPVENSNECTCTNRGIVSKTLFKFQWFQVSFKNWTILQCTDMWCLWSLAVTTLSVFQHWGTPYLLFWRSEHKCRIHKSSPSLSTAHHIIYNNGLQQSCFLSCSWADWAFFIHTPIHWSNSYNCPKSWSWGLSS